MTPEQRKKFLAVIDDRFGVTSSPRRLSEVLDESFVQKLEALSDLQAIEYLKTVDEPELSGAYYFLSKKLAPAALAELCLGYMTRRTFEARVIGIGGTGIWLMGTRDERVSRALAQIARDPAEHAAIRWKAYQSLECINKGESTSYKIVLDDPSFWDRPIETWLDKVDWSFVDSFLDEAAGGMP